MESEMPHHQRNLVDLCFEEGEYDAAIDILGQFRCSRCRPSKSHIRQLVYIALLSYSDRQARIDPSASPSKRQRKMVELPSAAASLAAQVLLMSFAATNTPAAVMLALRPGDPESVADQEGFLATESLCISRCKNCWQILADGFLLSDHQMASKGKGKLHSTGSFGDLRDTPDMRSPVGETAWPILEWLLSIFERDEERTTETHLRHSSLLSEQLGTPSRRDTDAPLAICIYCFRQSDLRRRILGVRLLNLLINLSSATDLDLALIVVSIFNGLSGEDIASLLSSLSPSPAVSKFKIAFPQPVHDQQARAQPKGSSVKARESTQPISLVNKYRAPSAADILRLLEEAPTTTSATSPLSIKFNLLVSYHELQAQVPPAERDAEWMEVVQNGAMLDKTFGCKPAVYRDLLEAILNI
ncbi:hypothetical protein C8F01DRAFT_1102547 [Mycena amicta]|nr:hypothetical protein C8F01DRAFT_1102547 [Mycena amicta]